MEQGSALIRLEGVNKIFYTEEMETHALSDIHLQIRPGTDGALALGFHHLIFENGWQDQEFLDQ